MSDKTNEFYSRLREQLENTSGWPSKYLYKFVVPTVQEKIEQVYVVFDNMGAVINTTASKTGKYTSISVEVQMQSPDHVIEKYKEVSNIEGILSL
ncbi:MAG: DUF493 family protein [Bacteroidota bacterium]|nr:DUF493 family protein [Bacteroidota bacterium]